MGSVFSSRNAEVIQWHLDVGGGEALWWGLCKHNQHHLVDMSTTAYVRTVTLENVRKKFVFKNARG